MTYTLVVLVLYLFGWWLVVMALHHGTVRLVLRWWPWLSTGST